jgi:hypothetical protein
VEGAEIWYNVIMSIRSLILGQLALADVFRLKSARSYASVSCHVAVTIMWPMEQSKVRFHCCVSEELFPLCFATMRTGVLIL